MAAEHDTSVLVVCDNILQVIHFRKRSHFSDIAAAESASTKIETQRIISGLVETGGKTHNRILPAVHHQSVAQYHQRLRSTTGVVIRTH